MPLPKSLLRRPVRRTSTSSSTGKPQRKRCRTCNNLDPRDHSSSIYPDEDEKESKACLTLTVDALALSKTKSVAQAGCRFCNAIMQALDAFFEEWRGTRVKICIELREKGTIMVSIDSKRRRFPFSHALALFSCVFWRLDVTNITIYSSVPGP
jgi:hypothetical protein